MSGSRSELLAFLGLYALLYAAFGVQSPFVPALLGERGLRAEQIGWILGVSRAIRVLAGPGIAHAADRSRRHRSVLCICAILAAVAGIGFLVMQGAMSLLVAALLQAAMLAPIVPISDALATTAAHRSESQGLRFDYGWLRAAGSAAFVAGTMVSGWAVDKGGLSIAMWVSGLFLVLGGTISLLLPQISDMPRIPSAPRTSIVRDWKLLWHLGSYRRLLVVATLVEGSHALHDTFAVIRWRAADIDFLAISVLWSEAVASEVLIFLVFGSRLIRWLGAGGAIALAAGAGVVRWTVVGVTTSPMFLALVQPLHGLTFALLHLAAMRLIVAVVPIHLAATAQSVYGTFCIGLASALLTWVSGLLYEQMGGQAFLVMAGLCLLALPMCTSLRLPERRAEEVGLTEG